MVEQPQIRCSPEQSRAFAQDDRAQFHRKAANSASFQRRLSIVQQILVFLPFRSTSAQTADFVHPRYIQAIYNRHASRQLAPGFDLHEVLTPLVSNRRIKRDGHRNRIRQRDAVFSSLFFVGFAGPAVALDGKSRHGIVESQNACDVAFVEHGVPAAGLPTNQLHWQAH